MWVSRELMTGGECGPVGLSCRLVRRPAGGYSLSHSTTHNCRRQGWHELRCARPAAMHKRPEDSEIPPAFICPITQELMQDPVTAADGHSYESSAISTIPSAILIIHSYSD